MLKLNISLSAIGIKLIANNISKMYYSLPILSKTLLLCFFLMQKLQCSPTSDGASACILANESFVKENKLEDKGKCLT